MGDRYAIHNVQDYFNDVITATYGGGALRVPMNGHTMAVAVGMSSAPASSFPEFGVFVVTPANSIIYGDASGDDDISAYDAALMARAAAGLITLTPEQTAYADVSGDGIVNDVDAALIARYAVGLITMFPSHECPYRAIPGTMGMGT